MNYHIFNKTFSFRHLKVETEAF